jgi:hypothetical protein
MKRAQLIEKLMSEGFSEKTLVNFNDKQLEKFANKVLKEAQTVTTTKTVYNSKDPKDVAALNTALKDPNVNKDNIEVKEDEVISVGKLRKSKKVKPVFKNLHEFVENTINSNYHSLVTKGDMVSLVKEKINESSELKERSTPRIPEFMSFDNIVSAGEKEAPEKDTPDVDAPPREKPDVDAPPQRDPRKSPFRRPNERPVVEPDPKAKVKRINSMQMAAE